MSEKPKVRVRAKADGTVIAIDGREISRMEANDPYVTFIRNGGRTDAGRHDIPELAGWAPSPRFSAAVTDGEARTVTGRAQDLDSNNSWINGGLDRRVENVIGGQIRLSAQPSIKILGRDYKWRMEWTGDVQERFKLWGNDINRRNDARQTLTFGKQMGLAYLLYMRDGRAAAEIRDLDRGLPNTTNVLLFAAERISTPRDGQAQESPKLRGGIAFNDNGAPEGYWIVSRHPGDRVNNRGADKWSYVPRFGPTGRHKIVHVFNPRYAEQTEGLSRLAEAMIPAKMLDRVDRAEVQAALKAAVLSFFITSPGTAADIADAIAPVDGANDDALWGIDKYLDYRAASPVKLESAQVIHLLPEEKVESPESTHPNSNYPSFAKFILQKIAGTLGISYPQLSQDWAGINYSSARALLNELWKSFLEDRHYFTQQFCTPIYAAWLEMEVANGDIKVPGGPSNFYRNKTAICMCEWIGPGRGSVDPLKEANANNLDIAAGRMSNVEAILERGRDPADVIAEEAWYLQAREDSRLEPPNYNVKAAADAAAADAAEGGGGSEEDRDGDGVSQEDKRKQERQAA